MKAMASARQARWAHAFFNNRMLPLAAGLASVGETRSEG